MRKHFLFGLLLSWLSSFGQKSEPGTSAGKRKVSQTDLNAVYAHYWQQGQHSAVTGGIGTEKLQVYAPSASLVRKPDSTNTYTVEGGVDVITSASTDKINFVVSSASRVDQRGHLNLGYSRRLNERGWEAGLTGAVSVESDYTSLGGILQLGHRDAARSRYWSARLEAYFDDLLWGRLNPGYYRAVRLIYPWELRLEDWFDIHNRNTFTLALAWERALNRRLALGIYPGLTYQRGLLSTPFHRVYFNDGMTEKVERLPNARWRLPVGVQLNAFLGGRLVLRNYYRFYYDDFGILANTLQVEAPVKWTPRWSAGPFVRVYGQSAARWFRPYAGHAVNQVFYTSDYDLSAFVSLDLGLTLRYAPFQFLGKNGHAQFSAAGLRLGTYRRSDGLSAYYLSTSFDFSFR